MRDLSHTREIWEDVIREFPKMFMQDEYEGYNGQYWSLPPRKILPKPYKKPHPAMWYACGNTSSYEMAARYGLGVLGFSVDSIDQLDPIMKSYKKNIPNAEPIVLGFNGSFRLLDAPDLYAGWNVPHDSATISA